MYSKYKHTQVGNNCEAYGKKSQPENSKKIGQQARLLNT